jgi:hypothetical protein
MPPKSPYNRKRLTKEEIAEGLELEEYQGEGRPKTRAECASVPRPCPYVRCRYHLYLDVKKRTIRIAWPKLDPTQMSASCALDEADANPDGMTLEDIGRRMNITRERSRQLEQAVIRKIRIRHAYETQVQELMDVWEVVSNLADVPWDLLE